MLKGGLGKQGRGAVRGNDGGACFESAAGSEDAVESEAPVTVWRIGYNED